jgi:hypothetical protein
MRRGTARHERSNLSKKSSGLLPEAEEAARIDQRIARYLADLDATDATENDDADAERTATALVQLKARRPNWPRWRRCWRRNTEGQPGKHLR